MFVCVCVCARECVSIQHRGCQQILAVFCRPLVATSVVAPPHFSTVGGFNHVNREKQAGNEGPEQEVRSDKRLRAAVFVLRAHGCDGQQGSGADSRLIKLPGHFLEFFFSP